MPTLNDIINQPHTSDFQSETQRQIADLLDNYNIGYLQNQPLVMNNGPQYQVHKPAFWLPQETNIIIDIAEDQSTSQNMHDLYTSNGFDTIIITPDNTTSPTWQYDVYQQIMDYTHNKTKTYDMLPLEYR